MTTPSYYPPGWSKERWLSATEEEFATLSDEQFATFHTGIRADLGEDGTQDFFNEMDQRQSEVRAAAASTRTEKRQPPNFVRALDQLRDEEGGLLEWGFVVFRTAGYGNESMIRDVKTRIEAEMDRQFDACCKSIEVEHAREMFRLMWIEREVLEGATTKEVARGFRALNVPIGLAHSLCLCVDESSMKSIQQEESGLSHVLAVSVTCGLEATGDEADDEWWTGSFKVSVSSLITELFADISDGALTPFEVGVGVTDDLVWTNNSRYGRQKASVEC